MPHWAICFEYPTNLKLSWEIWKFYWRNSSAFVHKCNLALVIIIIIKTEDRFVDFKRWSDLPFDLLILHLAQMFSVCRQSRSSYLPPEDACWHPWGFLGRVCLIVNGAGWQTQLPHIWRQVSSLSALGSRNLEFLLVQSTWPITQ